MLLAIIDIWQSEWHRQVTDCWCGCTECTNVSLNKRTDDCTMSMSVKICGHAASSRSYNKLTQVAINITLYCWVYVCRVMPPTTWVLSRPIGPLWFQLHLPPSENNRQTETTEAGSLKVKVNQIVAQNTKPKRVQNGRGKFAGKNDAQSNLERRRRWRGGGPGQDGYREGKIENQTYRKGVIF